VKIWIAAAKAVAGTALLAAVTAGLLGHVALASLAVLAGAALLVDGFQDAQSARRPPES
jgi:hypothetical protein